MARVQKLTNDLTDQLAFHSTGHSLGENQLLLLLRHIGEVYVLNEVKESIFELLIPMTDNNFLYLLEIVLILLFCTLRHVLNILLSIERYLQSATKGIHALQILAIL